MTFESYGPVWRLGQTFPFSYFNHLQEKQIRKCFEWIILKHCYQINMFQNELQSIIIYIFYRSVGLTIIGIWIRRIKSLNICFIISLSTISVTFSLVISFRIKHTISLSWNERKVRENIDSLKLKVIQIVHWQLIINLVLDIDTKSFTILKIHR